MADNNNVIIDIDNLRARKVHTDDKQHHHLVMHLKVVDDYND